MKIKRYCIKYIKYKKKMMKRIKMALMIGLCFLALDASAQKVAVKTNLLYDATSTINLGVEFALTPK